jgi:hypothetical protein
MPPQQYKAPGKDFKIKLPFQALTKLSCQIKSVVNIVSMRWAFMIQIHSLKCRIVGLSIAVFQCGVRHG